MNVKDETDVKCALEETTNKFGRIDVVINNDGITHFSTIEEMNDASTREEFDVNIFLSIECYS
ncbi:hypothetical protein BCR32DRAFT_330056 [Anaeromyces robustus]|uniref:NAD(P)-binding protein n=1 Tax=Anaeromyces robustus TaxID=1754192 RepID=A0A1Y1WHC2_9FUNG|nr:hypothetical protein BCR32DRAFT_330056 [Anaeromyces robustus]|eukprot:ORX72524.1 hypothetical protein BCR32DRAFT_330056 [Anaeromyces robustus]